MVKSLKCSPTRYRDTTKFCLTALTYACRVAYRDPDTKSKGQWLLNTIDKLDIEVLHESLYSALANEISNWPDKELVRKEHLTILSRLVAKPQLLASYLSGIPAKILEELDLNTLLSTIIKYTPKQEHLELMIKAILKSGSEAYYQLSIFLVKALEMTTEDAIINILRSTFIPTSADDIIRFRYYLLALGQDTLDDKFFNTVLEGIYSVNNRELEPDLILKALKKHSRDIHLIFNSKIFDDLNEEDKYEFITVMGKFTDRTLRTARKLLRRSKPGFLTNIRRRISRHSTDGE